MYITIMTNFSFAVHHSLPVVCWQMSKLGLEEQQTGQVCVHLYGICTACILHMPIHDNSFQAYLCDYLDSSALNKDSPILRSLILVICMHHKWFVRNRLKRFLQIKENDTHFTTLVEGFRPLVYNINKGRHFGWKPHCRRAMGWYKFRSLKIKP